MNILSILRHKDEARHDGAKHPNRNNALRQPRNIDEAE